MAFHSVLFLTRNLPEYPPVKPPALIPVVFEGQEICRAVYYDHHYSVELPEHLDKLVRQGFLRLDFVYQSPNGFDTIEYQPGYKLSWLILVEVADILEL